jgi:hypothetical protein
MADLEDARKQIRYQLSRLSTENQHHSFEHLCRYLARYRICSNILPATGPVSKGGDQGRDFETFRTYLTEHPVGDAWFLGRVSVGPLAFPCSLTKKEDIAAKIRADVLTITGSGEPVVGIHYFCEAPVPVGDRHKLKDWAREHGVVLEIHDGDAIAEYLLDPDTYWLAVRFLSAPETYPRFADADDDWYDARRARWRDVSKPSGLADYEELREYARYALNQEDRRPDLPFWLARLQMLAEAGGDRSVRHRAIGELIALTMWAQRSLIGFEPFIRELMSAPEQYADASEASHAIYAMNFVLGAVQRNACAIDRQEIAAWRNQLKAVIEAQLRDAGGPAERASWLDTLGFFAFSADPFTDAPADPDGAFDAWKELLSIAGDVPLFPITRLARFFEKVIPFAGRHPEYRTVAARVDAIVAERAGAIAAAEIARDRAVKFHQGNDHVRALDQLHATRERWFTAETLEGSVLATLVAAGWYRELGLCFASKYYAMSAAFTAWTSDDQETRDRLPDAIRLVIEADYHQGAWLSVMEMLPVSIMAADHVLASADDEPPHALQRVILCAAQILRMTSRIAGAFEEFVRARLKDFAMADLVATLVDETPRWERLGDDEVRKMVTTSLSDVPYSDAGSPRVARWKTLGIGWIVEWPNNYAMNRLAEQFCASLQIACAHIAMIATSGNVQSCRIQIAPADDDTFDLALDLGGDDRVRSWSLHLPSSAADDSAFTFERSIQTFISTILADVLAGSEAEYERIRSETAGADVAAKMLIGASPLRRLLATFHPPNRFDETIRMATESTFGWLVREAREETPPRPQRDGDNGATP